MPVHSPLASPSATERALTRWGLSPKKRFGQHYLVDDGVVGKICRMAADPEPLPVLEVGPGIGTLTEALLLSGAQVLAVELDQNLEPVLADIAERYPERFTYLMKDALKLRPSELPGQFDIVANLPYAVAATIILDAFSRYSGLRSATVMVQREVAERIQADSGSKAYGGYTVKLALLAKVRGSFRVSRTSFHPQPNVDSTVLRLDRLAESEFADPVSWERARMLIDAAFAERRKTLRNSLRSALGPLGCDAADIDRMLAAAAIDGGRRAESLTVEEFAGFVNVASLHLAAANAKSEKKL